MARNLISRIPGLAALPWLLLLSYFGLVALSAGRQVSYAAELGTQWVITGADVLLPDGDGFRLASGLMVQGRGDRIEAVGTAEECPAVAADAVRIDGTGATLLQGLMDAWCHLNDPSDLDCALSAGVTTLRVMDSPSWLSRVLSQRAVDGVPTPRCVYFGPDLRRHVSRTESREGLASPKLRGTIQADIRRQVKQGVDGFTLGHDTPAELLRLVAVTTGRFHLPLSVRAPGKIPFKTALTQGDSIGSLEAFFGDWMTSDPSGSNARVLPSRRLLGERAIEAAGAERSAVTGLIEFVRTTQLLGVEEEPPAADFVRNRYENLEPSQLVVPEAQLASQSPLTRLRWSQAARHMRRKLPSSCLGTMRSGLPLLATLVKKLNEAGVPLVVGTGAGAPFVPMGTAVVDELELLCEIGMDPAASIAAASTEAASLMGLGNVGSIKPGARADLILVEGNPLTDIGALRRVRAVAAAGDWTTAKEFGSCREALQPVFDHEMEFVIAAAIDSAEGTADDLRARLEAYAKTSGVRVRRETVESVRDVYLTADDPQPMCAKVLSMFIAKHFMAP